MANDSVEFMLNFAQSGQLDKTISQMRTLNKLLQKNQELQTSTAQTTHTATEQAAKDYERLQREITQMQQQLNNSQGTAQVIALTAELKKLQGEYRRLQKEIEALTQKQAKNSQLTEKDILAQERLRAERNKQRKAARDQIKDEEALTYQINTQVRSIEELRKKNNALVRQRDKLDTSTRQGKKDFDNLTVAIRNNEAQLKKLDSQIGRHQRNVGNYRDSIRGLSSSLMQIAGIGGGIFLLGSALRSGINVIKDFEQANANLASVLGKSKEEISALTEDAKRLGATTVFTASEVANLQTEFAKLGFTEREILDATEATLGLAAATNTDLAKAAEVAGATVRGFGFNANETQRIVDVMAKSFSATALDMDKFAESMKYVAPIARAAGVSFEETTAMLGVLANAGVSGSQAGTSLRRILSDLTKTGKPLSEALGELAAKGITLKDAQDEVGRNAQTALIILSKQTDTVKILTEAFENAKGAAQQMAETQLNTLGGALKLLTSAWEGYILSVNDANGAGGKMANAIRFLAKNLDTILNIIIEVGKAFLIYKGALFATRMVMEAMKLKEFVAGLLAQKAATVEATASQNALNASMKANVFALVVVGVYELYNALSSLVDVQTEAEKAQRRLNQALEDSGKEFSAYKDRIKDQLKAIKDRYDLEIREAAGNSKKIAELNKKSLEEQEALIQGQLKNAQKGIEIRKQTIADVEKERKAKFEAYTEELRIIDQKKSRGEQPVMLEIEAEKTKAEILSLTNVINLAKNDILLYTQGIAEGAVMLRELSVEEREFQAGLTDEQKKELDKRLKIWQDYYKKLQDLIVSNIEDEYEREIAAEQLRFDRAKQEAEKELQDKNLLFKYLEQLEIEHRQNVDKINDKWTKIDEKKAEEQKKKADEEFKKRQEKVDKQREDSIKKYSQKQEDALKRREINLRNEGKTEDEIEADLTAYKIQLLEEEIKVREDLGHETIDLELELARTRGEIAADEAKRKKEEFDELRKMTDDFVQYSIQAANEAAQRTIQRNREALEVQKHNVAIQEELAKNGLENTLAFEKDIQAERERTLIEAERRAEKLKKIEAYYNLVASYAQTDPNTAPAKAFVQMKIADAIAAKLEDGGIVADQVAKQNGGILRGARHSRGGILIEAEGDEGIFSRKEMANLGRDNFYNLKEVLNRPMADMEFGAQNDSVAAIITAPAPVVDFTTLERKIERVERAIENKPVPSFMLDRNANLITKETAQKMIKYKVQKGKGFN